MPLGWNGGLLVIETNVVTTLFGERVPPILVVVMNGAVRLELTIILLNDGLIDVVVPELGRFVRADPSPINFPNVCILDCTIIEYADKVEVAIVDAVMLDAIIVDAIMLDVLKEEL